jgi:cholesterol oxidase
LVKTEFPVNVDAVVVGSGFGASVAACRLAQAGASVLVLERGRSYPPGSFPRSPRGLDTNLWDPPSGLYGMFDVWAFRHMESLVCSGLGGGSLIYANVLLRKDKDWFVDDSPGRPVEPWPVTYDELEPFYGQAEHMLGAQRYPFDRQPYSQTAKTRAMKEAAHRCGLPWMLPPLAVSFAPEGEPPGSPLADPLGNLHGNAPRRTCRLCGECDIGCNDGAKNTLDYNYLSRAGDAGATVRDLCEVKRIEPAPGGYRVGFVAHDPTQAEPPGSALHWVNCRRLVLGAGTFGTTYLLLRNRSALPSISPALGTRFSGNGDLLAFLRGAHRRVEGRDVPHPLNPEYGPVITCAVRAPDTLDGHGDVGRGFYMEDGGNPDFLDWVVEAGGAVQMGARVVAFLAKRYLAHLRGIPRSHLSADLARLLGGGESSATLLPLLTMGRDVPDGSLYLRDGNLELDWSTQSSGPYFDRVEATVGRMAEALGASVSNTPMWLFKSAVTVHALGGVPMGTTPDKGVVDRWGEVFGYRGLHAVDASVMPGPVGPNPSLTIAALAERAAAHIIETER